jgi:hypothetical protein
MENKEGKQVLLYPIKNAYPLRKANPSELTPDYHH